MVERFSRSPCPPPEPCEAEYFARSLRVLLAALPKRNSDDMSGELLVAAYRKKLGHLPKATIGHIFDRALTECQWFPTIAELLRFAHEWAMPSEDAHLRSAAEVLARNERQARLDETMAALQRGDLDGDQIAALPVRFLMIAETRGLIWSDGDGKYRPRPDPMFLDTSHG